jgi:hypothetical protein
MCLSGSVRFKNVSIDRCVKDYTLQKVGYLKSFEGCYMSFLAWFTAYKTIYTWCFLREASHVPQVGINPIQANP